MGSESKAFPAWSLKLLVEQKVTLYGGWRLTESRETDRDRWCWRNEICHEISQSMNHLIHGDEKLNSRRRGRRKIKIFEKSRMKKKCFREDS